MEAPLLLDRTVSYSPPNQTPRVMPMPPLQIDLCQDKTQTVPIAHKLNATTGVCSYATHPPHRRYIRGVHVRGALGERSQGAPVPEAAVPLRYVETVFLSH
jgi:hypothetical protein